METAAAQPAAQPAAAEAGSGPGYTTPPVGGTIPNLKAVGDVPLLTASPARPAWEASQSAIPRTPGGGLAPLPDLVSRGKGTWTDWMGKKLRVAKQVFQEQFGGATATIDIELNTQVAQLQASQAAYRNILRLAISMNDHLFGMVQAQKELSACFGELSAHQPELHQEFATNQESQKILYKNGASLLGALNFFTENLGTLVYTTIEDTMASYRDYQMNRLEYDAERLEFDKASKTLKTAEGIKKAEERYKSAEERFTKARASVFAKLQLLDSNKVSVMRKQLKLFNSAICAYFAGNQEALEQILAECHIASAAVGDSGKVEGWLEKLHTNVASHIAPAGRGKNAV